MRIDKLLWFLRFARTRGLAQELVETGHVRLNGRRVERLHSRVGAGDILTFPVSSGVRVVEVVTLPVRRGPASEAQACYRVLDEDSDFPLAAPETIHAARGDLQP